MPHIRSCRASAGHGAETPAAPMASATCCGRGAVFGSQGDALAFGPGVSLWENRMRTAMLVPALALTLTGVCGSAAAADEKYSDGLRAVGLTIDQQLVSFSVDAPSSTRSAARVRGLDGDRALVGIDFRVQNGTLYGVGDKGASTPSAVTRRRARSPS